MERTVTVSMKGLVVAALVLLALVTAYLLGGAGGTGGTEAVASTQETPAAAQPAGQADKRTLRMVGTGEATAVPDQLTFTLSVTNKQADLDQALAASSATMDRVLARLKGYGVKEGNVQTTGLQMYPTYDYFDYSPPVLTGYRVTQRAQVTVPELAQGGKAVTAAIEAGGNSVRASDLRLGISDPEAAMARARDAAVEAATAKAEQYAAATGQTLGEVLGLREVTGSSGGARDRLIFSNARMAAYDAQATLPISAGKEDLNVKVEVLWAFADSAD